MSIRDLHPGQHLHILSGWHQGAIARATRITDDRVTTHIDGRVVTFLAGGLPRMAPAKRGAR